MDMEGASSSSISVNTAIISALSEARLGPEGDRVVGSSRLGAGAAGATFDGAAGWAWRASHVGVIDAHRKRVGGASMSQAGRKQRHPALCLPHSGQLHSRWTKVEWVG